MDAVEQERVESGALRDFSRALEGNASPLRQAAGTNSSKTGRINLDPEKTRNGLAQLVLTLVKFLHELLERQAIRRIDAGTLSEEEIERLGTALMKQAQEIERIRDEFGLDEEDLNLDLGPLGKLL